MISGLDFTSLKGLESLAGDLKKQNQPLILMALNPTLQEKLNQANIKFCDSHEDLYEVLEEVPQIGVSFIQRRSSVPFSKEVNNNK